MKQFIRRLFFLNLGILVFGLGLVPQASAEAPPVINIGNTDRGNLPAVNTDMKTYKKLFGKANARPSEIWNPTSREAFLKQVRAEAKGKDTVLINYSGHMIRGTDGKAYIELLAPVGTKHSLVNKGGIDYLDTTKPGALKYHVALSEVVAASGAKNVGGIVDSCFSGACKADLKANCSGVNCRFLASASEKQTAGDGVFGQVLREKNHDLDKNGHITLGELLKSGEANFRNGKDQDWQSSRAIKIGQDFSKDLVISAPELKASAFGGGKAGAAKGVETAATSREPVHE
jgi:hypothetical protein